MSYIVLNLELQLGRSPPKYYTEMALALKFEYEAIETHELQEKWLLNKITEFRAIKDVSLLVLYEVTSYQIMYMQHGDKCIEFMANLNVKRLGDLSSIRQERRYASVIRNTVILFPPFLTCFAAL